VANVGERIKHAQAVADACAAAGKRDLAELYVRKNTQIETVRSQLIALKAADGPELVTTPPVESATKPTTAINAQATYDKRRKGK